jgi:hypothetical protein
MASSRIRRASLLARCLLFLGAVLTGAIGHRAAQAQQAPIYRQALVTRHNVVHHSADPKHFLQVGNGEFAYSFDVTGMQTLDRAFEHPIPLHTMSNWGWHSFPNTGDYRYEQTRSIFGRARIGSISRASAFGGKDRTKPAPRRPILLTSPRSSKPSICGRASRRAGSNFGASR